MNKLDYTKIKKRWREYNKFEQRELQQRLRLLSEQNTLETLQELYQFVYSLQNKMNWGLTSAKIKDLQRVHLMFGRVKG